MSSTRLEVLECFALVAETGSISKAARQLGISQPTLSRRISTLEETLGVKLLIREADGISLTDLGRHFLNQLTPAMERVVSLLDNLSNTNEKIAGEINIAALLAHGEAVLVPSILKFRERFPEIDFKIEFQKEIEILSAVREGRAELGIVTAVPEGNWARVKRLGDERAVLVTNFNHPKNINTVTELEKAKFVAYRTGDPLLDLYCKQNFKGFHRHRMQIAFTVNSHRSMIDVLQQNDFYAVLPHASVRNAIENHLLRLASEREVRGQIFVTYRADARLSKRCQTFLDYLTN